VHDTIRPDWFRAPPADRPGFVIKDSSAHRVPTAKKRGSRTGFVIDPFRRRKVYFESGLEEVLLRVLIAHPDVIDIQEQQRAVFMFNGELKEHFFDIVVTWRSGRRTAYAVKYRDDVDQELLAMLQAAAGDRNLRFAHQFRTLSETDVDRITIANASAIIRCARDFDFEAMDLLREHLPSYGPSVRLRDCGEIADLGSRGYRAGIALLQSGWLTITPGEPIGLDAVLCNEFTTNQRDQRASAAR
jgi:hypothetical protein